jgi:hypothetical protein
MAAVWIVARAQLRQRWRQGLVIVVLVTVVGTAALTALAGVRRTRSAPARLQAATAAPDAYAGVPTDEHGRADPEQVATVGRLPGAEAIAPYAVLFMVPEDLDLPAGREFDFVASVGTDERLGRDVLRPHIVDGRRARPGRPEEIVLNEDTARALDVVAGDTMRFESYGPEQAAEAEATGTLPGTPAGPTVDLEVVGIGRSASDLASGENFDNFPVLATPALYERYGAAIAGSEGLVLVTLRAGADAAAFVRGFEAAFGDKEAFVSSANEGDELSPSLRQAIDTESIALVGFAAVVALAGLVAIGQAFARQAAASAGEQASLRAFGLAPVARSAIGMIVALPVALVGASLALAGAVAASPLLPFGLAGRAEPDPGVDVDAVVLASGGVIAVVAVLALAAGAAWRVSRQLGGPFPGAASRAAPRRSWLARRLARTGASPVATTGVHMALETGGGRSSVPVRPAIVGAVVGVTGVVAALVVGASLDRLVDSPERYGWNWDVAVFAGSEPGRAEELAARVASRPDVAAAGAVDSRSALVAGRRVPANGFVGSIEPSVVEGRAPRARDEIALGADTLARVDRSIGDTVRVGRAGERHHMRIVGRVVLPAFDNDEPANGAAVVGDLARLGGQPDAGSGDVVVRLAPGADHDAVVADLERDGFSVLDTRRPTDVDTLAEIKILPFVLAGVLALIGALALAHALVITVRRRRRDLAVLEAFGFVRGQVRGAIAWQATTVAVIGVVVGVPLGLVTGRWAWAALVRGIGMADDPVRPILAILLVVVLALLVANAIAAVPARTAARTPPATALRTE